MPILNSWAFHMRYIKKRTTRHKTIDNIVTAVCITIPDDVLVRNDWLSTIVPPQPQLGYRGDRLKSHKAMVGETAWRLLPKSFYVFIQPLSPQVTLPQETLVPEMMLPYMSTLYVALNTVPRWI